MSSDARRKAAYGVQVPQPLSSPLAAAVQVPQPLSSPLAAAPVQLTATPGSQQGRAQPQVRPAAPAQAHEGSDSEVSEDGQVVPSANAGNPHGGLGALVHDVQQQQQRIQQRQGGTRYSSIHPATRNCRLRQEYLQAGGRWRMACRKGPGSAGRRRPWPQIPMPLISGLRAAMCLCPGPPVPRRKRLRGPQVASSRGPQLQPGPHRCLSCRQRRPRVHNLLQQLQQGHRQRPLQILRPRWALSACHIYDISALHSSLWPISCESLVRMKKV